MFCLAEILSQAKSSTQSGHPREVTKALRVSLCVSLKGAATDQEHRIGQAHASLPCPIASRSQCCPADFKPHWPIAQFPAKPSHFCCPSSLRPFQRPPSPPAAPEKVGGYMCCPMAVQGSNPSGKNQHLKEADRSSVLCANILIIHPDTPTSESKHIRARLSHPTAISQHNLPCPAVPRAAKLSRDLLSDPTEQGGVTEV